MGIILGFRPSAAPWRPQRPTAVGWSTGSVQDDYEFSNPTSAFVHNNNIAEAEFFFSPDQASGHRDVPNDDLLPRVVVRRADIEHGEDGHDDDEDRRVREVLARAQAAAESERVVVRVELGFLAREALRLELERLVVVRLVPRYSPAMMMISYELGMDGARRGDCLTRCSGKRSFLWVPSSLRKSSRQKLSGGRLRRDSVPSR